jgi:hypothetical protein
MRLRPPLLVCALTPTTWRGRGLAGLRSKRCYPQVQAAKTPGWWNVAVAWAVYVPIVYEHEAVPADALRTVRFACFQFFCQALRIALGTDALSLVMHAS